MEGEREKKTSRTLNTTHWKLSHGPFPPFFSCHSWEYAPREQKTYLEFWWKTSRSGAWCSTALQLALGRTVTCDLANLQQAQEPHSTNTAWQRDSLLPSELVSHTLHFCHYSKNPTALRWPARQNPQIIKYFCIFIYTLIKSWGNFNLSFLFFASETGSHVA